MTRVLVVDDEAQMRRALEINLRARGYEVDAASTGEDALRLAPDSRPDVVLLDLGLPGIGGTEVVRGLRGWSSVPIIILSVRDGEADKVAALDAGADDYVTKPFGIDELLARLRAALRRRPAADESAVVRTAELTIDLGRGKVWRHDAEVQLTATEWQLLMHLVTNPGRLLTPRWLLERVWGGDERDTSILRVYLAQLRRKLEPDPSRPRYLITEPGMGYRFEPDQSGYDVSPPPPRR